MKPQMRFFWVLSLVFFTTGCSRYQVACYTQSEGSAEFYQEISESCQLEPGDHVILGLVDGERVNGKILFYSDQEMVLDPAGKSIQPRGFSSEQIQYIETDTEQLHPAAAIAIVGGALLVGGAVYLASEMSEFGIGQN